MRLAQFAAVFNRTAALSLLAAGAAAQAAPTYTDYGAIRYLEAGWTSDTMTVAHGTPTMTNPNSCPVVNAGYATSPSDAGRSLFHSMLMAAFLNRKEVSLVVDGCVYGKPRVVGVSVR